MIKVYGSPKRQDGLYKIGREKFELIYGYGEDENGGWNWRQRFSHKPDLDEIKATILATINSEVQNRIQSSFVWNSKPIWLSNENQMNFNSAYTIAVSTNGSNLPIKFKIGEDSDGKVIYHTFTKIESLAEFIQKQSAHIQECLKAGWKEKDALDLTEFMIIK